MFTKPSISVLILVFTKFILGEICRLTDVIEKMQAELTTSKTQLTQSQRIEHQTRADAATIREATKNRDDRIRELQVDL